MQEKELKILNYLKDQTSYVTALNIAENLGFSIRSVKTYISNINTNYPNLILSSRKGYFIQDKERLANILNNFTNNDIPQSSKNRQAYILKLLLLQQQTKNLDELADELCISPVTLMNEISKIKAELKNFDLVFKTKNNCVYIEGLEKNKKKMISHLIYNEIKENFISLDLLQTYFQNLDLKVIKEVVTEKLLANHYFINDFSLINFILHLAITMQRSMENLTTPEVLDSLNNVHITEPVSKLLMEICDDLKKYFPIHFTDNEFYNLALILTTSIVNENITKLEYSQLNEIIGSKICNLMELIQNKVKNALYINLDNPDFVMRFSLHLCNMLIRLENNINLRNPQLLSIKNTYPYIYDVSVFIANIITEETGYAISEDEIAYISLHIGVLIEEQKALRNKVKVIILCPRYYSTHLKLVKKIHAIFENDIILSGVITTPDELKNFSDYDLVISTVHVNICLTVPMIIISNYFDNKDMSIIANEIEKIKKARLRTILEKKLKFIFKRELFFYNPGFSNKEDAINYLSNALYKFGYVDSSFQERINEREKISPSAYLNIAIPHPLEMSAFSTAIAISIHPTPINWNQNKVNVVFMLAINEEDRILFRDIFDFVTEIILNKKYFEELLKTKTYEDFIHLLVASV
ncbi:hypothetical protein BVF91_09625 [Thermoanaerobacterium sp. PSU-2]|uniref:BglG family transcription antiterminator n=1 Tax=Thermoanaerobacterium sp. PSU-2 TaxID=1930849 RepID=UPI000A162D9E|nr:PTS sugar transporter subunit IIA [Thermoanaerobacterium sp. PSU-2]ORX22893.1 hypothetical protein BVF91_09625 [Thermoanaerobacterium sp. PSU-2]